VDVDELIVIERRRRVVGAGWTTGKRHVKYFDSELAGLTIALGKAIPGLFHRRERG